MVQIAESYGGQIETVEYSEILMELGGMGCLLRFLASEQYGPDLF